MKAKTLRCFVVVFLAMAMGILSFADGQREKDFETSLHEGFALHQQQRFSEALPLLRRALQLKPKDYFANLLVGIDLVRTGKRDEAIPYLKTASRLRPNEEFPYEYLGEAEAGLKHYGEAAAAYSTAAKVAPQSSQAAVALVDFSLARFAQISSQLRSTKLGLAAEYRLEALSHPSRDPVRLQLLRRSLELDADNSATWSDLAYAQFAGNDPISAQDTVTQALNRNSENLNAWFVQALLAAQKSDWNSASAKLNAIGVRSRTMLARFIDLWPASLQPSAATTVSGAAADFLACSKLVCSKNDCGVETLRRKLPHKLAVKASLRENFRDQRWDQVASTPGKFPLERGIAYAQMGDCERATTHLEASLNSPPATVPALFSLSLCYAQLAGAAGDQYQAHGGEEAVIRTMRGDVLLRLHANSGAAIAEYKGALALQPNDPRTLEHLAEAQLAEGEYDGAKESARSALSIDAHRASARRTLSKIAIQERDYPAALPLLKDLSLRDPQDVGLRVDLATVYAQTGAPQDALKNLAPALKAGYPDEKGTLHYLLGTVLRDLGRLPEAKAAFDTARQLSDSYQQTARGDHDIQK
jgi:tetratricopeptide (TPR) repeat protein